jgi:hypothetical protein
MLTCRMEMATAGPEKMSSQQQESCRVLKGQFALLRMLCLHVFLQIHGLKGGKVICTRVT